MATAVYPLPSPWQPHLPLRRNGSWHILESIGIEMGWIWFLGGAIIYILSAVTYARMSCERTTRKMLAPASDRGGEGLQRLDIFNPFCRCGRVALAPLW